MHKEKKTFFKGKFNKNDKPIHTTHSRNAMRYYSAYDVSTTHSDSRLKDNHEIIEVLVQTTHRYPNWSE